MKTYHITENIARAGHIASLDKIARLGGSILVRGWWQAQAISIYHGDGSEEHNAPSILLRLAASTTKTDKDGTPIIRLPVVEDGVIVYRPMTVEDFAARVEEYKTRVIAEGEPIVCVADGRHRALALTLLSILGHDVEPSMVEVEPEEGIRVALEATQNNLHTLQASAAEQLSAGIHVLRDMLSRDEAITEASFGRRCSLSDRRTVLQSTYAKARLVVEAGMPLEKVQDLKREQAMKLCKATPDERDGMLATWASEAQEAVSPLSTKQIKECAERCNALLKPEMDAIVQGRRGALESVTYTKAADCAGVLVARMVDLLPSDVLKTLGDTLKAGAKEAATREKESKADKADKAD